MTKTIPYAFAPILNLALRQIGAQYIDYTGLQNVGCVVLNEICLQILTDFDPLISNLKTVFSSKLQFSSNRVILNLRIFMILPT